MKNACAALLAPILALSACAKPTHQIAPDFAKAHSFRGRSCVQLVAERNRRAEQLVFARLRQDQVSRDDDTRTFGVPSLFGTTFEGDQEETVAVLKADLRLIDQELQSTRCIYPSARPL